MSSWPFPGLSKAWFGGLPLARCSADEVSVVHPPSVLPVHSACPATARRPLSLLAGQNLRRCDPGLLRFPDDSAHGRLIHRRSVFSDQTGSSVHAVKL
jgi:hypothetical protein